jgi:hypothetical protein
MPSNTKQITRDNLTVTLALTKLSGNKFAYFSATAELRHPRTGRIESCGAMHDAILAKFPEVADFVALHLADENGEPMYAVENGYYWLAGALGGLGEKYTGLNGSPEKSVEECLAIFASHVRISVEQADDLIATFKGGQGKVREQFAAWCITQRPRWRAEADAIVAKYLAVVAS